MRSRIWLSIALGLGVALAPGAGSAQTPVAILEIPIRSTATGMASSMTEGRMILGGETWNLTASGLSVARAGVAKYLAVAVVTNAKDAESIAGHYTGTVTGELANESGATLRLAATRPGIELVLGPDGLSIDLSR